MSIVRIEPAPKWIRGFNGTTAVVDSKRAQLVWEHPYYPQWYVPVDDVHDDTLPTTAIDELPDHVKVRWSAVERWFEEDVEVLIHPRDPYRRVDALPSSRHVVVRVDGQVVADSPRPTILFETGLPPRYYLPVDDVRIDLLRESDTTTGCPYKGYARYWDLHLGDTVYEDFVWSYDDPLPESAPVKGLLCFYNEKVDLEIDGEPIERVASKFS
ncbi:MAG: DUF427 domain-containing protein [Acidimicrobiales bacterium]|nr:DUF427 domain-containing protein [Acidimicrobiales bacterium]